MCPIPTAGVCQRRMALGRPARTRRFVNNMVDVPGLMHVAALASTAQRSHYSNYGTGIEICAPSSNSHAYFRMQVAGRA